MKFYKKFKFLISIPKNSLSILTKNPMKQAVFHFYYKQNDNDAAVLKKLKSFKNTETARPKSTTANTDSFQQNEALLKTFDSFRNTEALHSKNTKQMSNNMDDSRKTGIGQHASIFSKPRNRPANQQHSVLFNRESGRKVGAVSDQSAG